MNHREKIEYLINDFQVRGLKKGMAAPPVYRLLLKLGFEIPPPAFQSTKRRLLITSLTQSSLWGLMMYSFVVDEWFWEFPLLCAGFGVYMAITFDFLSYGSIRRLNLPSWDQYPGQNA